MPLFHLTPFFQARAEIKKKKSFVLWFKCKLYTLVSRFTDLLIKYQNAINNKPVLNVLSKENMDSLLGDEGAFRG